MTSISLLSAEANALAFTPLYLQFHVPALRISTKLSFKLKPGGSKHIFKAIEDNVLSFTDALRDDLVSIDRNEIVEEFASMSERAVQSLEEWQEFVDEWKATLIGRLSELDKQVKNANEKVEAARASEQEVNELLREKDIQINSLLMQDQLKSPIVPTPPQALVGGSRRPSGASTQGLAASIMNRFQRRPSNIGIPSPAISEADPDSPKPQLKRRASFGNVFSGFGRRKSDDSVNVEALLNAEKINPRKSATVATLPDELLNAEKIRPRASQVGGELTATVTSQLSGASSAVSSFDTRQEESTERRVKQTARQEESTECHTEASGRPSYNSSKSSQSDEYDGDSSVSSLSLPQEDAIEMCSVPEEEDDDLLSSRSAQNAPATTKAPSKKKRPPPSPEITFTAVEPMVEKKSTADKSTQSFTSICHRAVQCTLFSELPPNAPVGFHSSVDLGYIKHRGVGSFIPSSPRLPAIRRFASTQC